jgi:membrane protein
MGGQRFVGDRGTRLRSRYQDSFAQQSFARLNAVDFADRVVLFGAALLLSVLPMLILLGALASTRIDDDVARHLGLNARGSEILEGLFRAKAASFGVAVLIALATAVAGTITVAGIVQVTYERCFDLDHRPGVRNVARCVIWLVVAAAVLVGDAMISQPVGRLAIGPELIGLGDLVGLAVFFWWTAHFLLAGRESWTRLLPLAVATSVFWVALGLIGSVYFSSSIITDEKLYGALGIVFDLTTWFIAAGAVIALGAVVGSVWVERHQDSRGRPSDLTSAVAPPGERGLDA